MKNQTSIMEAKIEGIVVGIIITVFFHNVELTPNLILFLIAVFSIGVLFQLRKIK